MAEGVFDPVFLAVECVEAVDEAGLVGDVDAAVVNCGG